MPKLRIELNAGLQTFTQGKNKDNIPLRKKDGTVIYCPFDGFMDYSCRWNGPKVKIANIKSYSADELGRDSLFYGSKAVALGIWYNSAVHCILKDGLPIVWCEISDRPRLKIACPVINIRDCKKASGYL